MGKGKIIVIEGACDGVGKQTQCELLKEKLISEGNKVISHSFPSYGNYQGKVVEEYLNGKYGNVSELSPYFVNSLYAVDRAVTWNTKLKKVYDSGGVVVLDRYTTSSVIYQSVLIDDLEERKKFIDYVCDYEYEKLGIGKPDKIIFLCPSFDVATKMRKSRKGKEGVSNDVYERDLVLMKKIYENALFVADYYKWDIVTCDYENKLRSVQDIHNDICKMIDKLIYSKK